MAKAKAVPIKKSELVIAVKDMNTVMQMKPALKADDKMKYGELVGVVKKLAGEAFTTDEFNPTTWALIKKLNIEVKEPEENPELKDGFTGKEGEPEEEELPEEEEAPKKSAKKATVKPKKTSTVKKAVTRPGCIGKVINEMKKGSSCEVEKLAQEVNKMYIKHNGKDNLKESKALILYVAKVLEPLNIISVEDGKIHKL